MRPGPCRSSGRCTRASSRSSACHRRRSPPRRWRRRTLAYTSYLLAVAYGAPFHEALAALLPCYWIYWEVGKTLERATSPDPLYARWIATYASDEFGDVVRAVLACTDAVAERLRAAERDDDAPARAHDEPLRVDVLGHGLAPRGLAGLSQGEPRRSGTHHVSVTVPRDARHAGSLASNYRFHDISPARAGGWHPPCLIQVRHESGAG